MIDVNWNNFNSSAYIADNYAKTHEEDIQIIKILVRYYDKLPQLQSALEIGVGPNLYPLMIMLPYIKKIDCIDISVSNIKYFNQQLKNPNPNWNLFWSLLQRLNPKYKQDYKKSLLNKVSINNKSIYRLNEDIYDLVSTNFCLESITDNSKEFILACNKFIASARSGGYLIATFMENSHGYEVDGIRFPGFPVNKEKIYKVFQPKVNSLEIKRIKVAAKPLREGYTGMLVLTARKK